MIIAYLVFTAIPMAIYIPRSLAALRLRSVSVDR
jgi:hypothetical protein